MSAWELVSHDRISIDFLFHYQVLLFCFLFLRAEINSFYLACLSVFVVFLFSGLCCLVIVLKVLLSLLYISRWFYYTVLIYLVVLFILDELIYTLVFLCFLTSYIFLFIILLKQEKFLFFFPFSFSHFKRVGFVNSSVHESSFVWGLVDNHGVLNIVSSVTQYCNYCIDSLWIFGETQIIESSVLN